jgi:hypothetical protein
LFVITFFTCADVCAAGCWAQCIADVAMCLLQQFRNGSRVGDVVHLVVGGVTVVVTATPFLWFALFLVTPCDEKKKIMLYCLGFFEFRFVRIGVFGSALLGANPLAV